MRYDNYRGESISALGALGGSSFTWGIYGAWGEWVAYRNIMKFHAAADSSVYARLWQNTNQRLNFEVRRGGTSRGVNSAVDTITLNAAHLLVVSWDAASRKVVIRVDGSEVVNVTLGDPGSVSGFDRYEQTGDRIDVGRCVVTDDFKMGADSVALEDYLSAYGA